MRSNSYVVLSQIRTDVTSTGCGRNMAQTFATAAGIIEVEGFGVMVECRGDLATSRAHPGGVTVGHGHGRIS